VSGVPAPRSADLGIAGVVFDEIGLRFQVEIAYDDWVGIGAILGKIRDSTSWAIGDWLLAGEALFGDRVAQGIEATGRQKATLVEYARVASKVPRERRRGSLPWFHHKLVAALEPEEQMEWLDRAEATGWSSEELRGALHHGVAQRQNTSRARIEVLELVEDVARALIRASERLGDGYARIPEPILTRLENAVGERAP
jgi:hypothetical protein